MIDGMTSHWIGLYVYGYFAWQVSPLLHMSQIEPTHRIEIGQHVYALLLSFLIRRAPQLLQSYVDKVQSFLGLRLFYYISIRVVVSSYYIGSVGYYCYLALGYLDIWLVVAHMRQFHLWIMDLVSVDLLYNFSIVLLLDMDGIWLFGYLNSLPLLGMLWLLVYKNAL